MADLMEVRAALLEAGLVDEAAAIEMHLAYDVEREREATQEVRRLVQVKVDLETDLKVERERADRLQTENETLQAKLKAATDPLRLKRPRKSE